MRALVPGTRPPWVIAHRGASSSHPENTAAAFDEALAQRCDGIELDVQLSSDRVPVVYHDRTLRKVGRGRQRVPQLSARDLQQLDVGSWFDPRFGNERMLTLQQALQHYGSRTRLLVEIKARERDRAEGLHRSLAEAVSDVIRTNGREQRVTLLSFDAEVLAIATRGAPGLRAALNVRSLERITAELQLQLDSLFALSLDIRTVRSSLVRAAQALGKPVMVYTCNTPRRALRALHAGADAIMTDRPGWLRYFLEQRRAE